MSRLALAAVTLAAMTSVASAGTYVGLGIGTAANGSAERNDGIDYGSTDGFERSGRLMVGSRFGKLSIEGQGGRYDIVFDHLGYQATQLGLGAKLNLPIGNNFELFAKGGLERTWLSTQSATMHDAAGNGYFLGGGFEYRVNLGVTAASLFLDYQRSSTDFTNDYMLQYSAVSSMWTIGATVSL